MNLHLQTSAVFTVGTALACVVGVGMLWLRDRSSYLRDWTLSMLLLLLTFALYGARDQLPLVLGHLLANTLLLACAQLSYTGYLRLFDLPVHGRRQVLATLTFFFVMWLARGEPLVRMLVGNACLLVLSLACLRVLWQQRRHFRATRQKRLSWPVLGLPLAAHGSTVLVSLSRMAYALTQDPSINTAGHNAQVLSLIVGAVGALAGAFGYTVLHGDRLRGELEHLARTDGLTGLFNRRAFDERLARDWHRHRLQRTPLTVLLLDVDHFKRLNDELGHAMGDEALRRLGAFLGKQVRSYDLAARIGGEEFCLLLSGCEAADALVRAQQLLQADLHVPTPAGERRFTLSIGLAQARAEDADAKALLARADAALYRAKQEGRHRCCEAE